MKTTAKVGDRQVLHGKVYEACAEQPNELGVPNCVGCVAEHAVQTLCRDLNLNTACYATRSKDVYVIWKEAIMPTEGQVNAQRLCDRLIELGLTEDVAELAVMYHMADQCYHGLSAEVNTDALLEIEPLNIMFPWFFAPEGSDFWRDQKAVYYRKVTRNV